MREESSPLHSSEHAASIYAYQVVASIHDIIQAMQVVLESDTLQVAVVKITLHFEQAEKLHTRHCSPTQQSARYFLDNLRSLVRKTDSVFLLDHAFYFFLLAANLQGGAIVQERLWEALLWRLHNAHESEVLRPQSVRIGYSAYPLPYKKLDQCLAAADETQHSFTLYTERPSHKTGQLAPRQLSQQAKEKELRALANQLGIPYLSLLPRKLPTRLRHLVSPKLAQELHCYPLGRERDTLTVAMLNPGDCQAVERLRQETGMDIFPVLAHPYELQSVLEQLV
jgi:hypothetical protein